MNKKVVLALDFDGLIADGADECILVSWNGYFGKSDVDFSESALAAIPAEFKERFLNHRSFAKHLGHFFMPFNDFGFFKTQQEFDDAYATLDAVCVEKFVTDVTAYRALVRLQYRQQWLNYHSFYDGVIHLLKNCSCPIYVVTAKDAQSVQEILQNENIIIPDSQVFGERRNKNEALLAIAEQMGIEPSQVHFYDDNILNARDAYIAGFSAYWAVWGYNAPEHFSLASELRLPVATLDRFTQKYLDESKESTSDKVFA